MHWVKPATLLLLLNLHRGGTNVGQSQTVITIIKKLQKAGVFHPAFLPVLMDKIVILELQNAAGMKARVPNYGANHQSFVVAGSKGNLYDVMLG